MLEQMRIYKYTNWDIKTITTYWELKKSMSTKRIELKCFHSHVLYIYV